MTFLPAACAPGQNPVDQMDAFFDSLNGRRPPPNAVTQQDSRTIVTSPGYAPAYPPYPAPVRTTE